MDSVAHFEIPADVMERAEEFYARAFGWSIRPLDHYDFTAVNTIEAEANSRVKVGSINGSIRKRDSQMKHIVVMIKVLNIEDSLARIEKLGGKTVVGKRSVSNIGFTAYFEDTERNLVGLWQDPE